jgi:hypothetical protein
MPNEEEREAEQRNDQNANRDPTSFAVRACAGVDLCCQFFAHVLSGLVAMQEGKRLATVARWYSARARAPRGDPAWSGG